MELFSWFPKAIIVLGIHDKLGHLTKTACIDPVLEGNHSIPSRNGIPVDGRIDYDVLGDVYKYVFGKRFDLAFWARGTPFI